MDKAVKIKKALLFAVTGAGAYIGLQVLGHGEKAWATLQTGLTQQLQVLLAGGVAGVFALLFPTTPKKDPGAPPSQPSHQPKQIAQDNEQQVPLSEYERVRAERNEWRVYGAAAQAYMQQQDSARELLDAKQTVLRVAIYGCMSLALLLCLVASLAPSIVITPVPESVFFVHLGHLLSAFAFAGFVLGAVVYRVRVHTVPQHAVRCALISSSVIAIGSMLVSLPYIFVRMWEQQLTAVGVTMPMLLWMAIFRLFVAPATCAILAYFGFYTAKAFTRVPTSNLKQD